jgi:NAD(P) transhydrogenase
VDVFIDNVFNFPTMAEGYRVAALDVAGKRARRAGSASAETVPQAV